jgi:hypothetical protein
VGSYYQGAILPTTRKNESLQFRKYFVPILLSMPVDDACTQDSTETDAAEDKEEEYASEDASIDEEASGEAAADESAVSSL